MTNIFNLPDDMAELKRLCIKTVGDEPNVASDALKEGVSATYVMIKSLAVFTDVIIFVLILILTELRKRNENK